MFLIRPPTALVRVVYNNPVVITGRNARRTQKTHDVLMVAVRLPGDDVHAWVLEAKAHKIGV
jgi:hypothetical protein